MNMILLNFTGTCMTGKRLETRQ